MKIELKTRYQYYYFLLQGDRGGCGGFTERYSYTQKPGRYSYTQKLCSPKNEKRSKKKDNKVDGCSETGDGLLRFRKRVILTQKFGTNEKSKYTYWS